MGPENKVGSKNRVGPENKVGPEHQAGPTNIVSFTKQLHIQAHAAKFSQADFKV